jgi:eukaryotic-like serine/threonine-protein kinase
VRSEIGADRWRRIEDILDVALARAPSDWDRVLSEFCGDDVELRAEVEALLRQSDKAAGFLDEPPAAAAAAAIQETKARRRASGQRVEGRRIGAYRLVREIGRGGMARVFLAERADGGFVHRVALKLLRPGLDTDVDHARFRAERQILASLAHANIARLLDGGATDDGLPYFVLEYVDGKPIDEYLNERQASVEERVRLFLTVCEATQHAHRNLVVHRDLKPSNILVDRDGVVKLLDFGLAKYPLPPGGLGPVSRATRRWMTPEYAAPEQIRGAPSTTLTDVYQLGAVLYELVTGEPPFAEYCVTLPAFERAILNDQPELPSESVSRKGLPDRAKALRGDLDAIVLKALRKEPDERFDSVDALERDLRAALIGDPVEARHNTTSYRMRRFIRRHRVETIATVSVVLAVLSGLVVSISLARRAAAERDRAATASREATAISSFLVNLFDASDPAESGGGKITASELVRRAAERAASFHAEPQVQAGMLEVTARLYHSLGEYPSETRLLNRALELRTRGGSSLEIAGTYQQIARALVGEGRFLDADSAVRRAVALQESVVGPRDRLVAATLLQSAGVTVFLGDLRTAERSSRRALSISESALGENDSATAHAHLMLGSILQREGQFERAEREYRRAWDGFATSLGAEDPEVAQSIMHVGYVLQNDARRLDEADSLFQRALAIRRKSLGEAHALVAATLNDIADLRLSRGDTTSALPLARQSFAITQKAYGPDHPLAVSSIQQMANNYARAGRLDLAEPLMRSVVPMMRRIRGDDHAAVASADIDLARIMIDRGEYAAAQPFVDDALRIERRAFGPDHPVTARSEAVLGRLRTRTGDLIAADSILQRSLGIIERHSGREQSDAREVFRWLAELETARGRPAEAARFRSFADLR